MHSSWFGPRQPKDAFSSFLTFEHSTLDRNAYGGETAMVVAVAGRAMVGEIAAGSPEGWRKLVDLNLIGPLATVRYALGHFPKEGRRDVVFVGSAGAITPLPGVGIYGATKRSLRAAFDTLRLELAATGISTGNELVMRPTGQINP